MNHLVLNPLPFLQQGDITPCMTVGDPDLFVPSYEEEGTSPREAETTAKRICQGCPVQTECLVYALNRPYLQGIWGGMSQEDRRRWRRANPGFTPSELDAPWADAHKRDWAQDLRENVS